MVNPCLRPTASIIPRSTIIILHSLVHLVSLTGLVNEVNEDSVRRRNKMNPHDYGKKIRHWLRDEDMLLIHLIPLLTPYSLLLGTSFTRHRVPHSFPYRTKWNVVRRKGRMWRENDRVTLSSLIPYGHSLRHGVSDGGTRWETPSERVKEWEWGGTDKKRPRYLRVSHSLTVASCPVPPPRREIDRVAPCGLLPTGCTWGETWRMNRTRRWWSFYIWGVSLCSLCLRLSVHTISFISSIVTGRDLPHTSVLFGYPPCICL